MSILNKQKTIKKAILIVIAVFSFACDDVEFSHYQPANPPVGLKMIKYDGDYILLFRSENINNNRFGGFLIFIDTDPNRLMTTIDFENIDINEQTAYIETADYKLAGNTYNKGINTDIVILFSDDEEDESEIEIENSIYTVTKRLLKDNIAAGSYLTLRTYLVDDNSVIISVSSPGNLVEVEL